MVDSKTVLDVVAKHGKTTEKLLQIYIQALRETYEKGDLASIGWIPVGTNFADALKERVKIESPLMKLMRPKSLSARPEGLATVKKKEDGAINGKN